MAKEKSRKKVGIMKEVGLPEGVSASLNELVLTIKGPHGESKRMLKKQSISIKIVSNKITFESEKATKENKKMIGSLEAHVKNMIKGSIHGHTYILKICSGHFPMNVSISGNKLHVKNFLGEKVPRVLQLKEGADVKVDGSAIHVTSPSKEIAGQVSADIEKLTRRPGFDTRIFQDGIYITTKDGRELK